MAKLSGSSSDPFATYHRIARCGQVLLFQLQHCRADPFDAVDKFQIGVHGSLGDSPIVDGVLLQLLCRIEKTGRCSHSSIEEFLLGRKATDPVSRFCECLRAGLKGGVNLPIRVRLALAAIEASYTQPDLDLSKVAATLGISAKYLSHTLKQFTGHGFREQLMEHRLKSAAEQLRDSPGNSIKQTWSQIGYNHASKFDRDFKRRYGLTPRQYREKFAYLTKSSNSENVIPDTDVVMATATDLVRGVPTARILLIDDDVVANELASHFLTAAGYETRWADKPSVALSIAPTFAPDLLVVDYQLPEMTGVECLSALRVKGCHASAIVLTGDCTASSHLNKFQRLRSRLVFKPISADELVQLVQQGLPCQADGSSLRRGSGQLHGLVSTKRASYS